MVKVPEYTPDVQLRPNFRAGIEVRATPEAFGSDIGRGLQSAAAGLGNLGDAVAQVKALEDEAVVRGARGDYMRQRDMLQYDDNGGGYLQSDGKAALDGFDKYAKRLGDLRLKVSSERNLTPSQAKLFLRTIEPLEADARRDGVVHKGAALKAYIVDGARAGADTFKLEAVRNSANPSQWQKYASAGLMEIATLGEKLGWPAAKLKQEQDDFLSDAHRLTALQMAEADPIAAGEYVQRHGDAMTVPDRLTLMNTLLPRLGEGAVSDAVALKSTRPGATEFAAAGLPPEAYQVLSVISGTEAPDYRTLNGGEKFSDFSDHPRRKGAGGASTAAGRYQFVKATWDRVSKALGLPDFSPISQDVAGWWLASTDYKTRTGRDLAADIKAGKFTEVRAGLADTWEGVKKLSDDKFAERMRTAAGQATVKVEGDAGKFSPRVEALLAGLPEGYAARVRELADTGVRQFEAETNAQIKAHRVAVADNYRLRIATDDVSLTRQEILDDPVLDNGDRATLVNSLAAAQKDALAVTQGVAAFQAGQLAVDPYDTDERKVVDGVWTQIAKTVEGPQRRSAMEELVRQTGVVPAPVLNAARSDLASTGVRQVAAAAETAARIRDIDPGALGRREGGKELQDAAATFRHLTKTVGLSPEQAAQRIVDLRDPEKVQARAALMKAEPIVAFVKDQATEGNVRDIFDPGIFGFDPKLGETPAQAAAMVGEYRDILEESVFDAAGDTAHATALAADRFRRRYGVSDFTLSGSKVVTRLPVEVAYPAGQDGTHGYVREQIMEALSGAGISADKVYLQSDALTDRDFASGRPARYRVYYEKHGVLEGYKLPFFATPPKAATSAAARARAEAQRDENRRRLEAGRDREGNLDRFLDGNPLMGR